MNLFRKSRLVQKDHFRADAANPLAGGESQLLRLAPHGSSTRTEYYPGGRSPSVEPPWLQEYRYGDSPVPVPQTPQSHFGQTTQLLPQIREQEQPNVLEEDDPIATVPEPHINTLPPRFLLKDPSTKVQPPIELVNQIERARKGAASYDGQEAVYQVQITPPVRQRTLPTGVEIDPDDIALSTFDIPKAETNTSTWENSTTLLAPPIGDVPMSSPGARSPSQGSPYDISRPTCSLNVVCYRSGAKGCLLKQIQTVLQSRFKDQAAFERTCKKNPALIATDKALFQELGRLYREDMCGFWRRRFSLKTLQGLRVLSYSPITRPAIVPFDDFVLQEMLYAYMHPSKISTSTEWVEWVFRLRRGDRRHALELVEGWDTLRIIIAGTFPWLISCIVGVVYAVLTHDAQSAFTVASFILTSATVMLALLAVISGIESSGRASFNP